MWNWFRERLKMFGVSFAGGLGGLIITALVAAGLPLDENMKASILQWIASMMVFILPNTGQSFASMDMAMGLMDSDDRRRAATRALKPIKWDALKAAIVTGAISVATWWTGFWGAIFGATPPTP